MSSLDIEHLRTLVAIVNCGGFGKAATARSISQPALSQHIRHLERRLNRKLFEKDGRTMRLTNDGEQVLSEARRILATHDQALARLQAGAERVVVIGSVEHSVEQLLPEMIRVINEAFPDVTTRFEIGRSTSLADSVERGTVDFAIVLASRGDEGGRKLGSMPLRWFSAPGWALPDDDDPFRLVAFEEPCALRERAHAALGAEGHRVEVAGQSSTLDGVLAGARAGLGVALLPSIGGAVPAGLVVRDDLPSVGVAGLRIVTRQGLDPDIKATAFEVGAAFFQRSHLRRLDLTA